MENKDKIIFADETELLLESGASIGRLEVKFDSLADFGTTWDKFTNENLKSVRIENKEGLVAGIYKNLTPQKPLISSMDKDSEGKILVTFSLRKKTEMELTLEQMQEDLKVHDGAINDVATAVADMAEGV